MQNNTEALLYGVQILVAAIYCAWVGRKRGFPIPKIIAWVFFSFLLPVIAILMLPKEKITITQPIQE